MSLYAFCQGALLAGFVLAAPTAFAQTTTDQAPTASGSGRMGGMAGRQAQMLKDLNLTADQQTKVEALMAANRAAMQNRPSGPPTDAERQAMQTRRAEMDAKLKDILTPEQYTKYQAMRPGNR